MTGRDRRELLLGALAAVGLGWWLSIGLASHHVVDLQVYLGTLREVRDGVGLYDALATTSDGDTLGFTYPPFAAVVLAPLSLLPLGGALAVLTTASALALAGSLVVLVRAAGVARWPRAVAVALPVAVVCEPVVATLSYGQVNLVLLGVVCAGLGRARGVGVGVAVGLAAGVKLTPAGLLLAPLVHGRWRELATGVAVGLGTVGLGALVFPAATRAYLTGTATETTRVGDVARVANQSWRGALERLDLPVAAWVVAVVVTLAVGVVALRRGAGPVPELGVAALVVLLVSPVSWTHHWVWALPVVVALVVAGGVHRGLGVAGVLVGVVWTFGRVDRVPTDGPVWSQLLAWVYQDSLVLWAAVVLVVLAVRPLRTGPAR